MTRIADLEASDPSSRTTPSGARSSQFTPARTTGSMAIRSACSWRLRHERLCRDPARSMGLHDDQPRHGRPALAGAAARAGDDDRGRHTRAHTAEVLPVVEDVTVHRGLVTVETVPVTSLPGLELLDRPAMPLGDHSLEDRPWQGRLQPAERGRDVRRIDVVAGVGPRGSRRRGRPRSAARGHAARTRRPSPVVATVGDEHARLLAAAGEVRIPAARRSARSRRRRGSRRPPAGHRPRPSA